uniref:Helicase domino n=2 Tax=Globodera pallida TaxID=36090 RepID=A0A183BRV5_GLOPA
MNFTGENSSQFERNDLYEVLLRNFCSESSTAQGNAAPSTPAIEQRFAEETYEFRTAFDELSLVADKSSDVFGEDQPSTSAEATPYKSIEIMFGDENDVAQQPSTSSPSFSSHPETIQDAKIYSRIRELREAGLWSATRLPKCEDPPRRKTHWDYLLEEVRWISTDFVNERKTKKELARKLAIKAKSEWQRLYKSTKEIKKKEQDDKEAKRICSSVAKMIRDFWVNVDKVVDFRANEIVESKKRKALGQQLNFLVGAADKIYGRKFVTIRTQRFVRGNAAPSTPAIEQRFAEETYEFRTAFDELSLVADKSSDVFGEDQPSTSAEATPYKSIEIMFGDENDVAQQPSTSSPSFSSHPETIQDAKIYSRIRELREAGLWSATRLPKCEDPPRRKTHWDYLLEEVRWISTDFVNERKTKKELARKLAIKAKSEWQRLYKSTKEIKKKEQDDKEDQKDMQFSRKDDQGLLAMSQEEERSESDRMTTDGEDDERTMETEEAHQQKAHVELEVNELSKEANMEHDEFLTSLPSGYLESIGFKMPIPRFAVDEHELTTSSQVESADDRTDGQLLAGEEKPDLKNVDYAGLSSDNSEVRRKQLDNIAVAALEFQPRGYTLETTEVKTVTPFLLRGDLREYQLVGLDWLVTLYEKNLNGILADEMGLGKTIQTIALLAHLACARAVWGPHLIIVPTSVILNWEMELKKWCPALKVLTYFGTAKERAEKRKGWSKSNAFHVCITSYKLATQDVRAFKKKAWQYLILDEAQNIKNFKSQRWQTLLRLQSRRRLLLTGTPLQNSLMELWALLHFLMPHVFASHDDFKEWFHTPITGMVEGTAEVDQALVQRLHKILRPFILRRLKAEVEKQLPTKTEKIIPCPLSKRQRFLYNEFLSRRSTVDNLKSGNMLSVLGIIIQLRKCCNHPNLFEPRPVLSPFVLPPVVPQFPRPALAVRAQLEHSKPNHLLTINDALSFQKSWDLFERLCDLTSSAACLAAPNFLSVEEAPPITENLVKFVGDEDGGRFYRVEHDDQQQAKEGDDLINNICNGGDQRLVNNTRKRKLPTDFHLQNSGKASPISFKIVREEETLSNIFQSARRELQKMLKSRTKESRRIGIWLSTEKKLRGGPILSRETQDFVAVNSIGIEPSNSSELFNGRRRTAIRNLDDQLGSELFDRVCHTIQQRTVEWIEMSLNRFLICVLRVLTTGCFPQPLITAYEKYDQDLCQHSLQCYADWSYLAEKTYIARQLEFPELRLIEYDCGKLQLLARLLERLFLNKHRCLIFTQMSRMLDILQAFLSYHNYKYFRLDGSTHIDQRQAMMERFNTDDSVFCFILSTRSGGVGVNLTGADTVIFYDSDWNPTMDAQAQDRCHRIGQTRNVTIYRLISEKTIEENILAKSMQKRRLGEMAIDQGEFTPDFFKDSGNLRDLFSNETAIAEIIAPVVDEPENIKDVETAMNRVEDEQDAMAAQLAKDEGNAEVAEFDENLNGASTSYDLRDIDSPSEQYLELISGLKPVERYAVSFLANEYRPALDKEVEEAEAKIRAKQLEFMEKHRHADVLLDVAEDEGTVGGRRRRKDGADDKELLGDLSYDATASAAVDELDLFSHALPFACESPFDDIPIWMPPSPPNSEADGSCLPSFDIYSPIDGAMLYQPELITEDKLPPLPPLLPSLDAFPRCISRSPRKARPSPPRAVPKHRRRSASATKNGLAKEERQQTQKGIGGIQPERATLKETTSERRLVDAVFERPPSPPDSAPSTPMVLAPVNIIMSVPPMPQLLPVPGHIIMVASPPATMPPELEQIGAIGDLAAAPSSSSVVHAAAAATTALPTSTLDESIESTLRKSRKHVQSPSPSSFVPVPRYLVRNFGPSPQRPFERIGPDSSRNIFRLVCPEWRTNFNALSMPGFAVTEPADIEGIPWSAAEDQRLLKAISERHCLLNVAEQQLLTRAGLQFNWEFVSQYVNVRSNQFRSPRQCAWRYQNFILRCDEAFEESSIGWRGPSAHFSRRPRTSFGTPPHSVIFDTNLGAQEAASAARRRATALTDCALLRRRTAPAVPERTTESQSQLLCLAGRMPPTQDARLNDLGARYTNVVRATDIIDVRRQMLERRAHNQQQRQTPGAGPPH